MALVVTLCLFKSFDERVGYADSRVLVGAGTNAKLLNTPIVNAPRKIHFHNAQMVIQRQELLRLEDSINLEAHRRNRWAIETSA